MKKILFIGMLLIGCEDNKGKQSEFDSSLPTLNLDKFRIVEAGGGFGMATTYSLSFSGYIINTTENVFKTYRQQIIFTAANGNQTTGEITLPMFRWLCPFDSLYGGGKSENVETATYIDSVVSWEAIESGLIVNYGTGNECDNN
jgi:hypothetical protein|tara:strand:- start:42 stop:473 length:432 start_codon:yes stop_codon:yes gene_type:complete